VAALRLLPVEDKPDEIAVPRDLVSRQPNPKFAEDAI